MTRYFVSYTEIDAESGLAVERNAGFPTLAEARAALAEPGRTAMPQVHPTLGVVQVLVRTVTDEAETW